MANQTAGLIFPLVISNGSHSISSVVDLIHSSIKIILSWPLFTKFYEGNFGSRIHEVIEEPNDNILISLVRRFVIDSISTWEKRIDLISLQIHREEHKLTVELTYNIKELNIINTFYYNYNI